MHFNIGIYLSLSNIMCENFLIITYTINNSRGHIKSKFQREDNIKKFINLSILWHNKN